MEKFLQENFPLRHLLNEEICHQRCSLDKWLGPAPIVISTVNDEWKMKIPTWKFCIESHLQLLCEKNDLQFWVQFSMHVWHMYVCSYSDLWLNCVGNGFFVQSLGNYNLNSSHYLPKAIRYVFVSIKALIICFFANIIKCI